MFQHEAAHGVVHLILRGNAGSQNALLIERDLDVYKRQLEISPEKSKIVNLKRHYSEFLGFKLKVRTKGKKPDGQPRYVVCLLYTSKVFVAENVKALLMKRHASSLERVITDFSELGYNISYHLYNAADYGVPQIRERVIIVGVRKDIKNEFIPPLAVTSERPITAKEAIDDLAKHPMDESISHIWSAAKPSSGQGLRYLTANNPATTMRSECHGNLQFHYSQPRRISMREAARIQSFPDDFEFVAKLRETERMIGNAVPPVFAWHIAQSVMQVLGNGVSYPNG